MEKRTLAECCIKGCEKQIRSLGFCDSHYAQWRRYGHPLSSELKYIRHGHRGADSETPEYRSWQAMKKRCHDPNTPSYSNYGGRGITVCDKWQNSFSRFLEDMGNIPYPSYTLDRINNDLGYFPDNCKWSSKAEQGANKRILF